MKSKVIFVGGLVLPILIFSVFVACNQKQEVKDKPDKKIECNLKSKIEYKEVSYEGVTLKIPVDWTLELDYILGLYQIYCFSEDGAASLCINWKRDPREIKKFSDKIKSAYSEESLNLTYTDYKSVHFLGNEAIFTKFTNDENIISELISFRIGEDNISIVISKDNLNSYDEILNSIKFNIAENRQKHINESKKSKPVVHKNWMSYNIADKIRLAIPDSYKLYLSGAKKIYNNEKIILQKIEKIPTENIRFKPKSFFEDSFDETYILIKYDQTKNGVGKYPGCYESLEDSEEMKVLKYNQFKKSISKNKLVESCSINYGKINGLAYRKSSYSYLRSGIIYINDTFLFCNCDEAATIEVESRITNKALSDSIIRTFDFIVRK